MHQKVNHGRRCAPARPANRLAVDERVQADVAGRGRCTTAASVVNLFFRDGSPTHVFAAGRDAIEAWRDRTEEDVLIARVRGRKKPVACITIQSADLQGSFVERLIGRVAKLGLSHAYSQNEYGAYVLYITSTPNGSLWDLLQARSTRERAMACHLV